MKGLSNMTFPVPARDTGYGIHDSAGVFSRPNNPESYAKWLYDNFGFRWYKLLCDGANKVDLARIYKRQGFEVICRLYRSRPHHDYVVSKDVVKAYVDVGARYIEWGNEPNLVDECAQGQPAPSELVVQFLKNYDIIMSAGGIPVTAALSPGGHYPHRQYFIEFLEGLKARKELTRLKDCAIGIHNRPLNHPLDYTDSSGCHFRDYEWYDDTIIMYLGQSQPLLGTEAGYEVGWKQDNRYPEITLTLHDAYNMDIIKGFASGKWRRSLYCQCFWLGEGFGHMTFKEAFWFNNPVYGPKVYHSIPELTNALPVAEHLYNFWRTSPFVRNLTQKEIAEMLQKHVIPQNLDSAFYKYARPRGWTSISGEIDINGVRYQVWLSKDGLTQHIVYAPIGQWHLTTHFDYPNRR